MTYLLLFIYTKFLKLFLVGIKPKFKRIMQQE